MVLILSATECIRYFNLPIPQGGRGVRATQVFGDGSSSTPPRQAVSSSSRRRGTLSPSELPQHFGEVFKTSPLRFVLEIYTFYFERTVHPTPRWATAPLSSQGGFALKVIQRGSYRRYCNGAYNFQDNFRSIILRFPHKFRVLFETQKYFSIRDFC
jgi:hypothetical protein